MDNEDFGKNNPKFQRYVPSCYRNRQKYIPSLYLMEKDGLPDKDTETFYTTQVIGNTTYKLVKGKWRPRVRKAPARKKEQVVVS